MTPVEEYILSCPEEHRERLTALRALILKAVPELNEKISWGMPTFFLNKNVIHFALNKAHIGVYPGPAAVTRFQDRLSGYKTAKGSIQLPLTKPLPDELVMDLTRWCAQNPSL